MCHRKDIPLAFSLPSSTPVSLFCLPVGHLQSDEPQAPQTQHVLNETSLPLSATPSVWGRAQANSETSKSSSLGPYLWEVLSIPKPTWLRSHSFLGPHMLTLGAWGFVTLPGTISAASWLVSLPQLPHPVSLSTLRARLPLRQETGFLSHHDEACVGFPMTQGWSVDLSN